MESLTLADKHFYKNVDGYNVYMTTDERVPPMFGGAFASRVSGLVVNMTTNPKEFEDCVVIHESLIGECLEEFVINHEIGHLKYGHVSDMFEIRTGWKRIAKALLVYIHRELQADNHAFLTSSAPAMAAGLAMLKFYYGISFAQKLMLRQRIHQLEVLMAV